MSASLPAVVRDVFRGPAHGNRLQHLELLRLLLLLLLLLLLQAHCECLFAAFPREGCPVSSTVLGSSSVLGGFPCTPVV